MPFAFVVAGLGFGDEGKGSIVDYLCAEYKIGTVVRYNGGAQAAHNVVNSGGSGDKTHTFAQFGSGTFWGARTHLSRFMVIDLNALGKEALALKELGVSNPMEMLSIEQDALLITPYHKAANRLKEIKRRHSRHGSCGMGIGETRRDFLAFGDAVPMVRDLVEPKKLREKLQFVKTTIMKELCNHTIETDPFSKEALGLLTMSVDDVVETWKEKYRFSIVDNSYLPTVVKKNNVVFEGAQGVLLDENYGFAPHTTWTDTTYTNADTLIKEAGDEFAVVRKIGVIRSFLTRHGAGPFPTEDKELRTGVLDDERNDVGDWQGMFRVGYLDLVLLRYALMVTKEQTEALAVTHMDKIDKIPKMCMSYSPRGTDGPHGHEFSDYMTDKLTLNKPGSWEHQGWLSNFLKDRVFPQYWPINNDFISVLQDCLGVKVNIQSFGPSYKDKQLAKY